MPACGCRAGLISGTALPMPGASLKVPSVRSGICWFAYRRLNAWVKEKNPPGSPRGCAGAGPDACLPPGVPCTPLQIPCPAGIGVEVPTSTPLSADHHPGHRVSLRFAPLSIADGALGGEELSAGISPGRSRLRAHPQPLNELYQHPPIREELTRRRLSSLPASPANPPVPC